MSTFDPRAIGRRVAASWDDQKQLRHRKDNQPDQFVDDGAVDAYALSARRSQIFERSRQAANQSG